MKLKKILIAFSGLALALGVVLGIELNNENKPQEAKAATSTAVTGLIIGLNDNAHNFASGCVIAVEYYGASNRTVKVDQIGDYLYSATLPVGTTGFNIYRLNPSEDAYLPYDGAPSTADGIRYNIFNYTYDSSKNMVVFDNNNFSTHDYVASDRTVVPAGARYIYHHDSTSWIGDWFQSNASPRLVTFANNYYGTYKQFIEMDRIGDSQFMEVTLDKTLCLDNYYYARLNPQASVGDGAVWSQTTDITINRTGGLVMGLTSGTDGKVNWQGSTTDDNYAELWGAVFMGNVTCSGSGSISSANWTRVNNEYSSLTNAQQGIVWNATGSIDGSTYLARAIYRYDYIVLYKKVKDPTTYSAYTDFITRSSSPNKTSFSGLAVVYRDVSNGSNSSSLAIVAVSSVITLLAFGGYFFLRKKHQ